MNREGAFSRPTNQVLPSTKAWSGRKTGMFVFSLFFLLFVGLAATREWLGTPDTQNYITTFNNFFEFNNQYEPGFEGILWLIKSLNGGVLSFLTVFAVAGVGLKFFAIKRYSKFIYLSVFIYFIKYYFLNELTQIRAGIAAGIFLIGVKYISERKWAPYLITVTLAILFHYSAIIYIILYFLCSDKISNNKFSLILFVSIVIILYFNLDRHLIDWAGERFPPIALYENLLNIGDYAKINFFNVGLLIKEMVLLLLLLKQNELRQKLPLFDIWLRMLLLSIWLFFVFRRLPVLAFRLSELMEISMIFIYPGIIYAIKDRFFGFGGFILVALALFYMNFSALQSFFHLA